jgi:hypothetical protein
MQTDDDCLIVAPVLDDDRPARRRHLLHDASEVSFGRGGGNSFSCFDHRGLLLSAEVLIN